MRESLLLLRRLTLTLLLGGLGISSAGGLAELWWLGATTEASFHRIRRAVERDFAQSRERLEALAVELAAHPDVATPPPRVDTRPQLFALTQSKIATGEDVSLTIYDGAGAARAWAGRPSDLPIDAAAQAGSFVVTFGERDVRLAYIAPVATPGDTGPARRPGLVVAEEILAAAPGLIGSSAGGFRLPSIIAEPRLRLPGASSPVDGSLWISLEAPVGRRVLEAEVSVAELRDARRDWRRTVLAIGLVYLGAVVLLTVAPVVTRPRRGVSRRAVLNRALLAGAGSAIAYGSWRLASGLLPWELGLLSSQTYRSPRLPGVLGHPVDVLLLGLLLLTLVLVSAFVVDQLRLGRRPARPGATPRSAAFVGTQLVAASTAVLTLAGFDLLVDDIVQGAAVDLLHTSLQPWDSGRIALLAALPIVSAATLWGMTLGLGTARLPWGDRRPDVVTSLTLALIWSLPATVLWALGWLEPTATLPLFAGAVAMALLMPQARPRFRHASHATRTLTLLAALVVPALLGYPTLLHHAEETRRTFVETRYAVQAAGHSEELQRDLETTLVQLDRRLGTEIETAGDGLRPTRADADRAFALWRRTELAARRRTSSIELHGPEGELVSRFALNFPEYAGTPLDRQVRGCEWEVFGETVPFASDERRVLHAERALCPSPDRPGDRRHPLGSVVVHVALDYRTLPFITPANPYTELLAPAPRRRLDDPVGQDVELVIYGWGLQPVFSSGEDAWTIDDALFRRIYASRLPFWTTLSKGGRAYATHIANNRIGIYAVGFPIFTVFDHLVRLAEIVTLSGLVFVTIALAVAGGDRLTVRRYRLGRTLLREIRTSFYRRLFLAFIAATLVPILALAFVIRNYVTAQLRADVEAGAARTATVAQRVIEDSVVFQQVGELPTAVVNDDLMVWISQVLDQEINIFRGSQLAATSERDLFAFGLLPTRTPDAVYSAILLDQLPSYVMEDTSGSQPYLVAATPVRALGPNSILTVSLASRQQEIERQIEDLDRGILLGVVIFVLVGAGIGLYMAERIADPVKRLTHATGQIARGDFDAHVMARSADELQQLVVSFNQMAVDLKRQQEQLEKTHRLEAWADMARQVAHEIKNPLTPVQLSAEHLLRVHADKGEPLGPVVRSCVESILTQVRLLRQISAEFSSYATRPSVNRQPTDLATLVDSVLEPYRIGLGNRIVIGVHIDRDLPSLPLDRTLVGRALTNVIENALHAMPGSGTLHITGTASRSEVRLDIADTGVGLEPESLRRIFEPYFSTKVTGTGLGMAIAKRNIELNDGTIEVSSRKDHGTTVTIRFSLARPGGGGGKKNAHADCSSPGSTPAASTGPSAEE